MMEEDKQELEFEITIKEKTSRGIVTQGFFK
jgi:hypothetical protein